MPAVRRATRQSLLKSVRLNAPPEVSRTAAQPWSASFAAYAALVDLFPARQGIYAQQMTDLGYAIDGSDTSTATMVGGAAAQAVLDFRHRDGANQLGDEPGERADLVC
jgi:hypothetical protein